MKMAMIFIMVVWSSFNPPNNARGSLASIRFQVHLPGSMK